MKKYTILSLVLFLSCTAVSIKKSNDLDTIILESDKQLTEKVGNTIPGAVIVFIEDGEIYYQNAYGFKDKNAHEAMSVDTIFQVASISKTVFAITVMKLRQEGLIDLNAPIDSYLKKWHLPDSKYNNDEVTAKKILSHSAGLSVGGYLGYRPETQLLSLEQSLSSLFYSVKLKRNPGYKWKYSGGGYTVLQLAVEEIIDRRLSEYTETNILKNMGMEKSSYAYNTSMNNELAKAYNSFGVQIPNYLYTETAAAGLYTTAHDLSILIIQMMNCYNNKENNLVINRKSLELMLTPEIDINKNESMGMGLFIYDVGNGVKTYGHGGVNRGWKAQYEFCPDKNSGIIVLSNGDLGGKIITPLISAWREYISKK